MSPMDRALDAFDQLVDAHPMVRRWRLWRLRRQDPVTHEAVMALLRADAGERDPLEAISHAIGDPPAAAADAPDVAGQRVGAWQLHERLGAGGMGVVHRATRADGQYAHEVAIKRILDAGPATIVRDALQAERNLLARLDHPGIVPILDAGLDAQGRPWFAMPLVDGSPIDTWADAHRLTPVQRVALLEQVCDAIAHAHARGVLHADLKPANVLVGPDGRPRVLDFGVAGLLRGGVPVIGAYSDGYAPPELVAGGVVDTRADVYALGVMLYRLCAADTPRRSLVHKLLASPGGGPDAPLASALARQATPRQLAARGMRDGRALAAVLRGDLDAIAHRAVEADPQRRYPSVDALRADLTAWRTRRPVSVRDTPGRRAVLFARRHVIACAVVGGMAVVLLGLGANAWQSSRRAALDAEATLVITELLDQSLGSAALTGMGAAQLSPRHLLGEAERTVRRHPASRDWRVLARGLTAIARSHIAVADYGNAGRLAQEALQLGGSDPWQRARSATVLAQANLARARFRDAERHARDGLAALGQGDDATTRAIRRPLEIALAEARWGQADTRGALAMIEALMDASPATDTASRTQRARLLILRGQWRAQLYRNQEAEADLRRAIAITAPDDAATADDARHALSQLLRTGRTTRAEALALAEAVVASRTRRFGPDHPETARARITLARSEMNNGRWTEAQATLARGHAVLEATLGPDSPELITPLVVAAIFNANGGSGGRAETERLHREAVRIALRAYGGDHRDTHFARATLAVYLCDWVGRGVDQDGRMLAEAIDLLRANIASRARQGLPAPFEWATLAKAYMLGADHDAARAALEQAIPQVEQAYGRDDGFWMALQGYRAELYLLEQRLDQADLVADRVIHEARRQVPTHIGNAMLVEGLRIKARIAEARGDRVSAKRWEREADAAMAATLAARG